MSYEELDKWVQINAPNLNKKMLHTQVASITASETPVSDFSTATVTINVDESASEGAWISIAIVVPNEDSTGVACVPVWPVGSSVLTVPLYKGKAFFTISGYYIITTSGSVVYDASDSLLVVTGDGTVNVAVQANS